MLFTLCPYTLVTPALVMQWTSTTSSCTFPVLFAVLALLLSWAALARVIKLPYCHIAGSKASNRNITGCLLLCRKDNVTFRCIRSLRQNMPSQCAHKYGSYPKLRSRCPVAHCTLLHSYEPSHIVLNGS